MGWFMQSFTFTCKHKSGKENMVVVIVQKEYFNFYLEVKVLGFHFIQEPYKVNIVSGLLNLSNSTEKSKARSKKALHMIFLGILLCMHNKVQRRDDIL